MGAAKRITKTMSEGGWTVTATWETKHGRPLSEGPSEMSVALASDADPKVKVRGYTTGVARRVDRMVSDMRAEVAEPELEHFYSLSDQELEEAVAKMPASPRRGPDEYYQGLLSLFFMLNASGHPAPINVISERLDIPKETVKTQLATARQRYR